MNIAEIDKNFKFGQVGDDVEWFDILEAPFSVHGVYYEPSEQMYRRLPKEVADATNEGVTYLSKNTAGGRVRFQTDSPYIAVRAVEYFTWFMAHMPVQGQCGFAVYENGDYLRTIAPDYPAFTSPVDISA